MGGSLAPLPPARASESGQGLDWRQARQPSAERALTARDLVRLRDIGPTGDDNPAAHIMAISPDGNWVAFQLRRADPETNRRSEEHTSELQSLMRISYAVFCLKKKNTTHNNKYTTTKNNITTKHINKNNTII